MCIVVEDEESRFLWGGGVWEEELRQHGGPRLCCFAMLEIPSSLCVYGDVGTVKMGVFSPPVRMRRRLPVEGDAVGLDVPERGHEDRDLAGLCFLSNACRTFRSASFGLIQWHHKSYLFLLSASLEIEEKETSEQA